MDENKVVLMQFLIRFDSSPEADLMVLVTRVSLEYVKFEKGIIGSLCALRDVVVSLSFCLYLQDIGF